MNSIRRRGFTIQQVATERAASPRMLKLRQRNYKLFCRCLSHLDA